MSQAAAMIQPSAAQQVVVETFIERFWNGHDETAAAELLTADYVDHAYQPQTVAGLRRTLAELTAAFPDHHCTVEALVAAADTVIARLTLRATHRGAFRGTPATGQRVEVTVYRTFRLEHGRIAEHWALLDTAGLLRQIGAAPAPANACAR